MPAATTTTTTLVLPTRAGHEEMLLACARLDGDRAARVAAVAEARDVDWDALLRLARPHGMIPLVADALGEAGVAPPAVRAGLERALRDNVRRNVFLTAELLKLLALLEARGVPAVPYKGPALAALLYGNVGLRQFGDLDVLVHDRDLLRARDLLLASGYSLFAPWTRAQQFNHEVNLVGVDGKLRVDVHGELFPQSVLALDPDGVWTRLRRTPLAGREVPSFSAEDLFLVLCVHADTHLWERLAWIADIARLVDVERGLDWSLLFERARASGSARIVSLGIVLAAELLAAPVPESVASRARAGLAVRALAADVLGRLFRDEPEGEAAKDLARSVFQLRSRERLRDRVRLLATPNEGDWERFPLPAPLYPLYYLLRPLRLLAKYGAGRRAVAIVAGVGALAAGGPSACGHRPAAAGGADHALDDSSNRRGSWDVIYEEELAEAHASYAWEAVEMLRPLMLKNRGRTSFIDPGADGTPAVFVDDQLWGRMGSLHSLPTMGIKSIRYLEPGEATFRYGIGYPSGVILVKYGP
ncbi:MAG TPA: nucleotidyltransferase family protein [Gemmatimonadaceae bacterium]|nr:nucleotidyltransferase family protein [Gemmatimonadaceae bacterium]